MNAELVYEANNVSFPCMRTIGAAKTNIWKEKLEAREERLQQNYAKGQRT